MGAVVFAAIVVAWRRGTLVRVRFFALSHLSDRAWSLPGLASRMETSWNRRVETFASQDVEPGDVVMVGDSITEGGDWPALLPGVRVHNQGIGGDDTDGVLRRVDLFADRRPAKVFLMIGTNDIGKGGNSTDVIVANVARIVERIRAASPGTEVYVQSVLPRIPRRREQVTSVNRGIGVCARERGATWIDLVPVFDRGDGQLRPELTLDSLHLNADGYRRWAEVLAPYLAGSRAAST
ncbi:MAG: GDSL-type esterase/lipase family protein [Acidimicrobiia bacterium]